MSKAAELSTFEFIVHTMASNGLWHKHEPVEAAYFQEQGAFTLLKDAFHMPVAAFRTELVAQIERSDEPLD